MSVRFVVTAAVMASIALISHAAARGKSRECKPSGMPSSLGEVGLVTVAQPVEYQAAAWLLVADKTIKPEKLRLVGSNGALIDLGKPPSTVEAAYWLARGRAVYALGRGRSQTAGQTDALLMRWGSDPRPRQTILHTSRAVEGPFAAAFSNEFLAASWAETGADGKLHRMLSFLDSEELRVAAPQDLGPDSGTAAHVQALPKGFAVSWIAEQGLMQAGFDLRGKPTGPASALAWSGKPPVRALAQCAGRSWLVHDAGEELALLSGQANGPMTELARLPKPPGSEALPIQCVDDGVVIGRRTLDPKAGNIIFWVSTVDATGKVRDRRIKDIRGTADDIRAAQFSMVGTKLSSWWVEGQGAVAKIWSREISCE